jgi:hypothetical protein
VRLTRRFNYPIETSKQTPRTINLNLILSELRPERDFSCPLEQCVRLQLRTENREEVEAIAALDPGEADETLPSNQRRSETPAEVETPRPTIAGRGL